MTDINLYIGLAIGAGIPTLVAVGVSLVKRLRRRDPSEVVDAAAVAA